MSADTHHWKLAAWRWKIRKRRLMRPRIAASGEAERELVDGENNHGTGINGGNPAAVHNNTGDE